MNASRITSGMLARGILSDTGQAAERLARTQRKLSSGKELERPSDNPYAVARAISMRGELEATRQHSRNVNEALAWQDVTDVALGGIGDSLQRARELALRGANDTLSSTDRIALAAEIEQLVDAVKEQANATYGGRHVLAGTATGTRPYALGGGDAYAGDTGVVAREIGPGVSIAINVRADEILGDGQAANDGRLLDTLRDVADHLRAGAPADLAALRGADLEGLDRNLDELSRMRADIGAGTSRLEAAANALLRTEETTLGLISDTEDADMAKGMVDFSIQQAALQAALKAGAGIMQASLLDFLR